jgi:hypothetical protein
MAAQLAALLDEPRRRRLGAWSRRVVEEQYSLGAATATLEQIYLEAATWAGAGRLRATLRTTLHRTAAELAGDALRDRLRPAVRSVLQRTAAG